MGFVDIVIKLCSNVNVICFNVCFSVEVDSLNMFLLGVDVLVGILLFDVFIKEVVKEMIIKVG